MILFETGTYSFTGKPMFNFSLVRQFPNDEEEYYQIHVDVLYIPTEENKDFQRTIWNEDIEEDILNGNNNQILEEYFQHIYEKYGFNESHLRLICKKIINKNFQLGSKELDFNYYKKFLKEDYNIV